MFLQFVVVSLVGLFRENVQEDDLFSSLCH